MNDLLNCLVILIESCKANKALFYPPQMKGQDGADDYTRLLLETGVHAQEKRNKGIMPDIHYVKSKSLFQMKFYKLNNNL